MIDNQENKPEVSYRVCLGFVFALSCLDPGEVAPPSWRVHIPEVNADLLRPVSPFIFFLPS
jgi:hypothetical protein